MKSRSGPYSRTPAEDACRHCGEGLREHCRECEACSGTHSAYCSKDQAQYRKRKRNPDSARELFESFHGAQPRERQAEVPEPKGPLMKIGRLLEIVYRPESPSNLKGKDFQHELSDDGTPWYSKKLKDKPILATDGVNLFIIRSRGSKLHFSNRGIIG